MLLRYDAFNFSLYDVYFTIEMAQLHGAWNALYVF